MDEHIKKLVNAWIDFHKNTDGKPDSDANYWAFDDLDEYTKSDPEKAWLIILNILSMDSSDIILANISAGPIESLLAYHGENWISQVEAEASKNSVFKTTLLGVFQNEMTDAVWDRLQNAAGRRAK